MKSEKIKIKKLILRIKPFFQQIFIEDKTKLILLLHQKTNFANIYDICNYTLWMFCFLL